MDDVAQLIGDRRRRQHAVEQQPQHGGGRVEGVHRAGLDVQEHGFAADESGLDLQARTRAARRSTWSRSCQELQVLRRRAEVPATRSTWPGTCSTSSARRRKEVRRTSAAPGSCDARPRSTADGGADSNPGSATSDCATTTNAPMTVRPASGPSRDAGTSRGRGPSRAGRREACPPRGRKDGGTDPPIRTRRIRRSAPRPGRPVPSRAACTGGDGEEVEGSVRRRGPSHYGVGDEHDGPIVPRQRRHR